MNSIKPVVTIIIPVYNVENYLKECLDSVLEQTFYNYEIIAIDDGSTDNSPNILKEYSNKFSRLKICLEKENKGQGFARNKGLKLAEGKYILFVDSDDYIERETLQVLVQEIENNNVDFVRFKARRFSNNNEFLSKIKKNRILLKENKIYINGSYKAIYLSYSPSPVLYLFKKDIVKRNKLKFPEGIIHEDELFSTLLFIYANSCIYVDKPFYNRRYREGSTMTTLTNEQKQKSFFSYINIIKSYKMLLKKSNISRLDQFFLKYRINSLFLQLKSSIENNNQKKVLLRLKEKKIYYSNLYRYYILFLKTILVLKIKI